MPPFWRRQLVQRMIGGAVVLAIYGCCTTVARLPAHLDAGEWLTALAWTVGMFAWAGALAGGLACFAGMLIGGLARPTLRPLLAALVESLLWLVLAAWLVANEVLYIAIGEVLGYGAIMMLYANPAATLEAAWDMGTKYILIILALVCVGGWLGFQLSLRSFRRWYASVPAEAAPGHATPLSKRSWRTGLAIIGGLAVWQACTWTSKAVPIMLRSSPPLRALNLAQALLGDPLAGPVPTTRGPKVISEEQYQSMMGQPRDPAPHVIYILMESTPAKALHCYGHPRADVTPNIDALAAEGVRFEHCQAAASFSSYGLVSANTSLYMLRDRWFDHFSDRSFPFLTFQKALKLAGYQLALFSSGNEAWDNIDQFCPRANYDAYFTQDTSGILEGDCMRMDDAHAVTRFEDWLAGRSDPRPMYVGFYLQSPHFNYEVPEPWASHYQPVPPLYSNGDGILQIPPAVLPLLKNQYDNAMRYADHWVGRIVEALRRAGALERSVIVITGDHGEAFMEHGLARHGVHTWEEMIHIPLIFYLGEQIRLTLRDGNPVENSGGAQRPIPAVVRDTVSSIDVAPTIAGLVGIAPYPGWQGLNVLGPEYSDRDRPIFSMTQYTRWQETVCINRLKYMYDLTEWQESLFDLAHDPGETQNLAEAQPAVAAAMRELLSGWHNHQLSYYDPRNRPFTHFIGRYEPAADVLARITAPGR